LFRKAGEYYRKLYGRDTHYTTMFSPGKYILWMLLMVSGFGFVNLFNLLFQRRNLFKGRDGTYRDFWILVSSSSFLYFTGPIIAIRGRHDMQRDFKFSNRWENDLPLKNHYPDCKGNKTCIDPFPILPPMPYLIHFLIREFSLLSYKLGVPVSSNC
jgi:hypothetical protein